MERWNYVLDGMVEKGWMTQAERDETTFPRFKKQDKSNQLAGQNGYILEAVKRELTAKGWSEAEIDGGGLTITTTIRRKPRTPRSPRSRVPDPSTRMRVCAWAWWRSNRAPARSWRCTAARTTSPTSWTTPCRAGPGRLHVQGVRSDRCPG